MSIIRTGVDFAKYDGDKTVMVFLRYEDKVSTIVGELSGEAAEYVAALEAERDELKAKLEAYDHLLECKRGWRWDLEQRGLNAVQAAMHMIACNKSAAQQEKEDG